MTQELAIQQSDLDFDDSPARFREGHPEDRFDGASGVLFEQAMAQTRMAITMCDPRQDGMPIVFANRAFRRLTGYGEDEIIGRNCRFLQGPKTDPRALDKVRAALESEDVIVVELLNYRKDGTPFWNALHLGPIYDSAGQVLYFFGSQWDVSDVRAARAEEQQARLLARELSHRMKNMFAVISGIVNITGRTRGVEEAASEINGRIQALGRAYETTLDEAAVGLIDIGPAIRSILAPYESGGTIDYAGGALRTSFSVVSTIGLTLHELAANAVRHGALSQAGGAVTVAWRRKSGDGDCLVLEWTEKGGPAVSAPGQDAGSGHSIVDRVIGMARGTITRDWRSEGLHVLVELPVEMAGD